MSSDLPEPGSGTQEASPHLAGEGSETYAVKLPIFEGPLDLLLHLIKINEVDVADIPIATIAEQYIEYLALLRELNLDVAGEYLVMAATLAWIKSRMILPPAGGDEEDEGLDPRAELVARLLEYQRFKEVADSMGELPLLGRDLYPAHAIEPESTPEEDRELSVDLVGLLEAFRRVLSRGVEVGGPHEVEGESITVLECMHAVMSKLEGVAVIEFDRLFEDDQGRVVSRTRLVTTFLALLELARLEAVRLYQGRTEAGAPQGAIQIRQAGSDDGRSWSERISEIM